MNDYLMPCGRTISAKTDIYKRCFIVVSAADFYSAFPECSKCSKSQYDCDAGILYCEGELLKMTDKFRLYDHFGYLEQMKNNGLLLGKPIFWTVKEDGSNTAIWYSDEAKKYRVSSRNQKVAMFEPNVLALEDVQKVIKFLDWVHEQYGSEYIVYGEYMPEGWSPTHLKHYEKPSYKVFDIWDMKRENFLDYYTMYNLMRPFDIPMVDLIAVTTSNSIEHLQKTQTDLLNLMDLKNQSFVCKIRRFFKRITGRLEEGLVAKCIDGNEHYFFKAKYFREKVKVVKDPSTKVYLPQMEKGEVLKCIYKVRDSLSEEDFKDAKIAMPKIAEEVGLEMKQTGTSNRAYKLFDLYRDVLNDN